MKTYHPLLLLFFSLVSMLPVLAPVRAAEPVASTIPGLVGWYDAQQFTQAEGTDVKTWPDRTEGEANQEAQDLSWWTNHADRNAKAPTLVTVSANGFEYRAVHFSAGEDGEFDLLAHPQVVKDGDESRTIMLVYRGGMDGPNSRVAGFGSKRVEGNDVQKKLWNLATDGEYGSSRFDGAAIGPYQAQGISRTDLILRTAVMHSETEFSEYIHPLHDFFADTRRLDRKEPSAKVGPIEGSFYVGDIHNMSGGGENGAADFDVLEILIFDRVLRDEERQKIQIDLRNKYTNEQKE